ncbi:MAG TPA: branched-chain-amino-acid transaminase [bacterium]|nr:branched-chain-amino-acid transaminase [bacterium]
MKIYINGKFYSKEDAKISVYDHGLLYGDGVFEGITFYNGKIFRLAQHIRRLYESAQTIMLKIPLSFGKMIEDVKKTVELSGLKNGYIRLIVTRGEGNLGLNPFTCQQPQVIIIADKIALYPKELYATGLNVITVPTLRTPSEAMSPRVKSLNYLNNIMAKMEAINAGADEALMLNANGFVAECAGDNIFTVKDNAVYTPGPSAGILKGVTRDAVIELAEKNGLMVYEIDMSRHDIYNADECFLTGSAAEIVPVIKLDGRTIGSGKPGPVTKTLLEQFKKLIETEPEVVCK